MYRVFRAQEGKVAVGNIRPVPNRTPDNLAALSAIIRLKAGLCPLERLEDITIDLQSHSNYLRNLLGSGERFGIILGPYGSGENAYPSSDQTSGFVAGIRRCASKSGYGPEFARSPGTACL